VVELCEFLVDHVGVTELGSTLHGRAALHVGCQARRFLDTERAASALMARVRELTVVSLPSDTWCCGFGGTFSVKYPEVSTAMGQRKLDTIMGADGW